MKRSKKPMCASPARQPRSRNPSSAPVGQLETARERRYRLRMEFSIDME
jgi:hypothetical protein